MKFDEYEQHELRAAFKDARTKAQDAPGRVQSAIAMAELTGRKPDYIQPLTGLRGGLLAKAIRSIKAMPDAVSAVAAEKAASGERAGDAIVYIASAEMEAFLEAAGFGDGPKAANLVEGK